MSFNPLHHHCGPFNKIRKRVSENIADRICQKHDIQYGQYQKRRKGLRAADPYWQFNEADRQFIENAKVSGSTAARMYATFFRGKRVLAPRMREDPDELNDEEKEYAPDDKRVRLLPDEPFNPLIEQDPELPQSEMPYGRGYKRRRRYGRRGYKRRHAFAKRVKRIVHADKHMSSLFKKKTTTWISAAAGVNTPVYTSIDMWTVAECRAQMDATPQMWSPAALPIAGKGTIAGFVNAYEQKEASVPGFGGKLVIDKASFMKVIIRNNDLTDCDLRIYAFRVAEHDETTLIDSLNNQTCKALGLGHAATTLAAQIEMYPTDVTKAMQSSWKRFGTVLKTRLKPGDEISYILPCKHGAIYDDTHWQTLAADDDAYVKNATSTCLIRSIGTLTHDVTPHVGLSTTFLDIQVEKHFAWKVKDDNLFWNTDAVTTQAVGVGLQVQEQVQQNP